VRRHLKASAALVAAAAAICILGPASAGAEVGHVFSSSFNVPDEPVSVAVDQASGSVYVLTTNTTAANAGKIYKFTSTGTPSNFTGLSPASNVIVSGCQQECRQIAVDNSGGINQGVIYLGSIQSLSFGGGGVRVYLPNGRPSSSIRNGVNQGIIVPRPFCGVSVDPAGVLYVTHSGDNLNQNFIQNEVNTYKPEQILPDPFPAQEWPIRAIHSNVGEIEPCRSAVDSHNHIYLTTDTASVTGQFLPRNIYRYTVDPFADGQPTGNVFVSGSTGLAVDQSTNDLYSNHLTSVRRFDESGDLRETFGAGKLSESGGIAVNATNGTVYAANRKDKNLQVFTTVVTPNLDSTASTSAQTTATLTAHIDDAGTGNITTCEFEIGPTTAYADPKVPCDASPLPYSGEKDVSASLTGLVKETTYHYRLILKNIYGTTEGPDRTFTTRNVKGVATGLATDVTQTTATLNGSFDGNGEPTSYYFEWGPVDGGPGGYANKTSTPPGDPAGSPTGTKEVSAPITGLSVYLPASTPYHYRMVAVNASGATHGPDRTFFAAPPHDPVISAVESSEVTGTGALISAQINPGNGPTVYSVQYGLSTAYESATTGGASIGSDDTDHPVSTVLSGLIPGRTYHYRIAASNFGGGSFSEDQTFNTPAPPVLGTSSATGIGQNVATLSSQINPGFGETTYYFEYGLTRGYGSTTPAVTLAARDNQVQDVSAALSGLYSGVLYHYRVIATNPLGTAEGPDQAFTTEPIPPKQEVRQRQTPTIACKKGQVKRKGKCVKRPKRKKQHGKKRSGR
jgi:hypothetical protein